MLRHIQDHLEAVYRTRAPDVRGFLISTAELDAALGSGRRSTDEWVVVRQGDGSVDIGVYIAPERLAALDAALDPRDALGRCFEAFCLATEGVSHFLLLFERAGRDEPITMLELEAQAEVDKFVSARLRDPLRAREWRARLFGQSVLAEGLSLEERDRYREATRLAVAFCDHLEGLPHEDAMLYELRTFWRASGHQRMDQLRRLAA